MNPWMSASASSDSFGVGMGSSALQFSFARDARRSRHRAIADNRQNRGLWIGAEEHFRRHLVQSEKAFERRKIAGAVWRKAVGRLPDGVEARQDHLGEFVDVAFPRPIVVAQHD